jgi:hypothetical protein
MDRIKDIKSGINFVKLVASTYSGIIKQVKKIDKKIH